MRLWSFHPRYLDRQGLLALWREALLARAVLRGRTRGYRLHPQLARFRDHDAPCAAISAYLAAIHAEAMSRGYAFDRRKVGVRCVDLAPIVVTSGQSRYEWGHLLRKLQQRSPALYRTWRRVESPDPHPIFALCEGPVAQWEKIARGASKRPRAEDARAAVRAGNAATLRRAGRR